MGLGGISRLSQGLRRAAACLRSQVVILMYHRIIDADSDPWGLCVTPRHFVEQMEHLQGGYVVLSLRSLARSLADGRLPRRAVVLTFDDGYVDNLWNAKPVLERNELPATVFVTAGYVGADREFWWDELERLLLFTPCLPQHLQLTLDGTSYEWDLGEWAQLPMVSQASHPQWRASRSEGPTPRHRAYRELHRLLWPLGHDEQRAALASLLSQANINGLPARTGYRALTADEVLGLAEGGLVEIGAHTITHPVLACRPFEAQREEITGGKKFLDDVLQASVTSFCYPYGGSADIGHTAVELVKQAGYTAACTTVPGTVTLRADPHYLPRFMVGSWDGEEFARRLKEFFQWDSRIP